ncbi:MAG: hypothetical protein Q8P41_31065 [Pseudomonadota bacterium]|nr:hypothetical protein [Pseudomonadota bacterium]
MPTPRRTGTREATLGAALQHLLPRLERSRRCPKWPPDLFALAARLLERTGAHVHVVNHWPLEAEGGDGAWRAEVAGIADGWLRRLGPASADWNRFRRGTVHLALANDDDLAAVWHQFPGAAARPDMNLLLLP